MRLLASIVLVAILAAPAIGQLYHVNPANGNVYMPTPPVADVFAARAAAIAVGGHLVTVDDAAEHEFLVKVFGDEPFWIGLNDELLEGIYEWSSGAVLDYTNWAAGQPDDSSASENWVYMNADATGAWADATFDAATGVHRGIIEFEGARDASTGHVYVRTGIVAGVHEARRQARLIGGNLVTIDDAAEDAFIQNAFGTSERLWIGLSDEAVEDTFVWDSGATSTYSNWFTGQPNNAAGNEHWVYMNQDAQGRWNDIRADGASIVTRGLVELEPKATERLAVQVIVEPDLSGCPSNLNTDSTALLGFGTSPGFLSLCASATVVVRLGVAAIDGLGPDLALSESLSSTTEAVRIDVSADGANWVTVPGPLSGSRHAGDAPIDISGTGLAQVEFVRITSFTTQTGGSSPGADYNALYVINYLPPRFEGETRPYADNIVAHTGITDVEEIIGAPDAHRYETYSNGFIAVEAGHVDMPTGSSMIVAFADHVVRDGNGPDLIVHEWGAPEGEDMLVEVSNDGMNWFPLSNVGSLTPRYGTESIATTEILAYDLATSGLATAELVRITAVGDPELDAIEAIHFTARPRTGSNDDIVMETRVNAMGSPESVVKLATTGDVLTLDMLSPGGTYLGTPPLVVAQYTPIDTAIPPFAGFPDVHVHSVVPGLVVLFSGAQLPPPVGPITLSSNGLSFAFNVPGGVAGNRLRLQSLAITSSAPNGFFAATDAHDIIFN